jgi:ATP-binding cassette subfamily B protein
LHLLQAYVYVRLMARAALSFAYERAKSWLLIARLVPLAGWRIVTGLLVVNLVIGLLPLAFIVATSVLLERVAGLAAQPPGAAGQSDVIAPLMLAVAALLLQSVLSPVQTGLSELVMGRVDGRCIHRLMMVGLVTAPLPVLEQRAVVDKLLSARQYLTQRWQTPGGAVDGLLALTARYGQLAGAVVLAWAGLGPLFGVLLGVMAIILRVSTRGSQTRWATYGQRSLIRPYQKMMYVFGVGSDTAISKEVRVLGLLPWLRARAGAESEAYYRPLWRKRRRIYFTPFLVLSVIVLVGVVAQLMLLRTHVADGGISVLRLSLGIQTILVPLRMGTFFPECDLKTMWGMVSYDILGELERHAVTEATSARPRVAQQPTALPRAYIRFESVGFSYPLSQRKILQDLDLELATGTSTAIVGLNGAGKTTLIKLLAGLYQPTCGRITVDGIDLRDLDTRGWQRRLAVIFQDYVRYQMDAATNIGMGAVGRLGHGEALRAAASWADADHVIRSLPAGLATPLSSQFAGGVDLSGGQWQRIALARALFAIGAGASVLVMDEPTAQLDARAEAAFLDRFLELTSGLTTIVISHRFSTARHADQIAVLDNGRIREQGSHQELLALNGHYAELFRLQAERFDAQAGPQLEDVP